ncbi:Uncharacterised protein [Mycobacteroides abscessus subsp. abscessus]|uniref:hypothetical protein n=1 Tax=Mycobacteroides abscessus TaxID=36809 RepID=UPI0009A8DEBE|nr:hypothetical protein [Mycobacteroides abscessus]SLI00842.1 Uncharacterised protein [Mycobacteroides abscessus subsp. abscessus]
MRRLRKVWESDNEAETAFVEEFLTNLAGGDVNAIDARTWERGQAAWEAAVWLFESMNKTNPEFTAMDYLTITKGAAPAPQVLKQFDLDG